MVGQRMLLKMLHCKGINVKRVKSNDSTTKELTAGATGEGTSFEKGIRKIDFKKMSEYSTCRICLKTGSIPIYGHDKSSNISKGLNAVCGIAVRFNDTFPKFLCQYCMDQLQSALILRRTALQSDKLLKQPIQDVSESDHSLDCLEGFKSISEEKNTAKEISRVTNIKSEYDDTHNNTYNSKEITVEVIKLENVEQENTSIEKIKLEENTTKDVKPNIKATKVQGKLLKVRKRSYCRRCKKSFATFKELNEHKMTEEHENMRQTCPICHNTYATLYFKKHLAVHKDEAPYLCDVCGRNFTLHATFTQHRRLHFYHLPFKCAHCPYKGRGKEALKMHMRSHTGERPYQCTQCPSKFINKSNLSKHLRIHNRVYDIQCDTCGKGFYSKPEMEMHIRADHMGIKDQVCSVCGKAFGYRKQMMKHQLKVHKREKLRAGKMPLYLKVEMMKQQEMEVPIESAET